MKKAKLYWEIRGYDGTKKLFVRHIPVGSLSETALLEALKALAAQNLTADELLGAYAKRKTKIANNLLDVSREGPHTIFYCGHHPHFTARMVKTLPAE